MNNSTILIIESDEWLAEQYERILGDEYKVLWAKNIVAAMQIVDSVMPDLIVADILLTGGTIFGLLHELQSYYDTGNIPIIVSTNLASELSIDDLRPYGVRLILDKNSMMPRDLLLEARKILS